MPLSLGGMDVPANCASIPVGLHQHMHETMNLSFRRYSQLMRKYRRRFNGRTHMEQDQVNALLKMQLEYLNKQPKLNTQGQKAYIRVMNQYTFWLRAQRRHNHTFQPRWGGLITEYSDALLNFYLT